MFQVKIPEHRDFGGEFVVHSFWEKLKMPDRLKELNFTSRERSLAESIVAGRLLKPGSELSTWSWLRNNSSICELTEHELENPGLSSVYKIGDRLLEHKKEIESHLLKVERKLYPEREVLYIFDLTNFYFEGQALGNSLAEYGKSKEKRNDCPLVSLGLIVDSSGFPVTSEVFPGNIGEPSTLSQILEKMGYFEDYLPEMRPTLVMDRGIATRDNVKLLTDMQLPYILITRGPRNNHYLEEFENHSNDPDFKSIVRDNNEIKIKKVEKTDTGKIEVLCISQGKRAKEDTTRRKWTERACEDLASLQRSILKGNIKSVKKINKKIGRLQERYTNFDKYFSVDIIEDSKRPGYALKLDFSENQVFDIDEFESDPLHGTYVIETVLKDKSAEDIWTLYMTLTRIEEAFWCMKSDLGTRPVYHQISRRTQAHLFISVIAYHLLVNIEYNMKQAGDTRRWATIRDVLKTHKRTTVIITDKKQRIHHIRISGQPESDHMDIYNKLKLKPKKT